MKSKSIVIIIAVVCLLVGGMTVTMFVTGVWGMNEMKITEFEGLNNLPRKPAKIEYVYFDEQQITVRLSDVDAKNVTDVIFSATYVKGKKGDLDGNNDVLVFHDEAGKTWTLKVGAIKGKNGYNYTLSDSATMQTILSQYRL